MYFSGLMRGIRSFSSASSYVPYHRKRERLPMRTFRRTVWASSSRLCAVAIFVQPLLLPMRFMARRLNTPSMVHMWTS